MRNKKLFWIMAVLFVVSSFIVEGAIGDVFRGLGDGMRNLTGGANILVFLINIIIIGVVLYLITNLIGGKFFKAESKTGKIVFFIVLIFLAGVIAYRVGGQWIWAEEAFIRPAFRYLFSGDDPIGILRPTRILIFIGASFLLYWLFISTINIGKEHKMVDLSVAILLAADMTHQGLTRGMLITFGQVISIWLLYRQFKKEGEANWNWSAAVWSGGLVIWISAIAFPGEGLFAVRWIGGWFKTIGIYGSLLAIVIAAVVLTAVGVFRNNREKDAEDKKKERRWKEDIIAYPFAALLRWLGKSRNPIVRWIYKLWDPNITTPEGKIPFPFRELRTEFMTLMNYMMRMEVYYAKKHGVTGTQEFLDEEIYSEKGLHQIFDIGEINKNLNSLKNGGGFELNSKGEFEPIPVEVLNDDGTKDKVDTGWNSTEWFIYKLFNLLKNKLESFESIGEEEYRDIKDDLNAELETIDGDLRAFKRRWGGEDFKGGGFTKRKGAYNVLESKRLFLLDQLRYHGRYDHTYRFANVDAKIYKVIPVWPTEKDENNSEKWKKPDLENVTPHFWRPVKKDEEFKYEVDANGYFISDLSAWVVEGQKGENNQGYIRKVDPGVQTVTVGGNRVKIKGIAEYILFNDAAKWLENEWDFYIWDVRDGRFHPNSRSAKDYSDVHAERGYDYSKVKPHSGPIGRENPAFDREALKDPVFDYIGRKWVGGYREEHVLKSKNIRPCITTLGMRNYIFSYLETKMKDDERFRENLSRYVYDSAVEKVEEEGGLFTKMPAATKKENE